MAVSYTTAADRDARHARRVAWQRHSLDLPLASTSILAMLLIAAAYQGIFRTPVPAAPPAAALNLNTVADAGALEPVFAVVFPLPADRRLAARETQAFLVQQDGGRRAIPNVGSIARVRVAEATIDRLPAGSPLRSRLADERARAVVAGREPPRSLALLTPGQLSAVKPLLVVRDRAEVRAALVMWVVLYVAAFHAVSLMWRIRRMPGDRLLLTAAHVLTAVGLAVMVSRQDPLRDLLLFPRYAVGVTIGLAVAALVSSINLRVSSLRHLSYVPLAGAFGLSLLLIAFGSGPAGSNAKVNLGPFQPIETIRVLLALFLAGYFARNWELLRAVRGDTGGLRLPAWVNLPRARYSAPVLIGVGAALALFFGQRDLGPALMLAVVFLASYAIARGTVGLALAGTALLVAGFYLGYRLEISTTLADRVRMWQEPWNNTARGGDQIAQALWAMSSGGWLGTGAGLGDTRYLPAGHTDLVLAALSEELGFAGLLAIALVYVAIAARALSTARRATTDYAFFLAIVLGLFLAVPVLIMGSGTLGLVPLTGVVTPFLSFGGSAMIANFSALGLLASIRSDRGTPAELASFAPAVRWLGGAMGVAAGVLVLAAGRVQLIRADDTVVKPHLGLQADGVRRYQYNPRILDIARRIPRGSITDRQGLPLATDDRDLIRTSSATYERIGISLETVCSDAAARCYPLGGRGFHLLGDAPTRRNWSASNTSFVERDSEARLRGFDDHPLPVTIRGMDGSPGSAVRRDFRDLVPILRHRYEPDHPAVKAAMETRRELRLTIDARLQVRVASILSEFARRSSTGRGAAVVIDPSGGDVLASISYPWPSPADLRSTEGSEAVNDALLDRARYGLYPPGSTFKLITAAAALRRDSRSAAEAFTCSRLPDGRVGAHVAGYGRPIRDDVKDTNAHGTIAMRHAVTVSCNAYFAQLAVQLGPRALVEIAEPAGISLARDNAERRIRDTLPQIGYGQGDVLVSPAGMARIVAALATDGRLRDLRVDSAVSSPPADFVSPAIARMIGGFMRDAVLDGTGRSVREIPTPIAGKTGTAEVTGAPSHSWFVGFAPYGPAERRIAVAVLLENAGYGGAGAAPAAGEIVSAAASLGLLR